MKRLVTALIAAVALVGCLSSANIKPLPPGAKACGGPGDCPAGYVCRFPGVDTYAQCVPAHWN